jgi:peptidoglycan/LPS O-acetylase OafA/YrhL
MSRAPGLDLLRAIAIAWVMYSHTQLFGLVSQDDPVANSGWMGVDLFFALSGFLIGGQLFRQYLGGAASPLRSEGGTSGVLVFYARRLLRTLPAYLVVVALYFAAPWWRERPTIQPLWQFLSFTENLFVDMRHAKSFSHVWSLCVEEQFYLLAPLIVWVTMLRPRLWKAVAVCSGVMLLGIVLRWSLWEQALAPLQGRDGFGTRWIETIYYPTWNRLDGLLCGMVFAAVRAFRPGWWAALTARANAVLAVGLVGLGVSLWLFHDQKALLASVIGYPILALSMAALVVAGASRTSLIGARAIPGASLLAALAYSLYLSHKAAYHLVALAAGKGLDAQPALKLFLSVALALVVGAGLYLAVERPFLTLRDRWFGGRAVAPEQAVAEAA